MESRAPIGFYNRNDRAISLNLSTNTLATAGIHYYSNILVHRKGYEDSLVLMTRVFDQDRVTKHILVSNTLGDDRDEILFRTATALLQNGEDKSCLLRFQVNDNNKLTFINRSLEELTENNL